MRIAIVVLIGITLAGVAHAQPLVRQQAQDRCKAEYKELTQQGQAGVPDQKTFLKTCLSDVNPVATLPGNATMRAPAGATGICKDGRYTAAVERNGACAGHGGLAHWIS